MEFQAEHLLSQKFRESTTKPELIEHYKKAYEYHTMMANHHKQLLADIAATITADLDKPKVTYTNKMAETMKAVLKKKQYEI